MECDFPYTIFGIGRKYSHKFNIVATLISDKENEDSYNFLQQTIKDAMKKYLNF